MRLRMERMFQNRVNDAKVVIWVTDGAQLDCAKV